MSQLAFEMDFERHLVELAGEIRERSYKVMPCTAFLVKKPVLREVFAADFRDRVVHHLLANDIEPLVNRSLITDCYSCREGYGTSFGIDRIEHHARSCTDNYTRRGYVLTMDIQAYFMSINRALLYAKMEELIGRSLYRKNGEGRLWKDVLDVEQLRFLLKTIIHHDPVQGCQINGDADEWDLLPRSKSLFHSPPGCGLPIGNLTSQLFSNVYLNELDHYIKRDLGMKHYGRYVDDFYVMHRDKEVLKELLPVISAFLKEKLQLTLHPDKIVLRDIAQGFTYLGIHLKPFRRYLSTRTRNSICTSIREIDRGADAGEAKGGCHALQARMNSYLGYMRHCKTYGCRKRLLESCSYLNGLMEFTSGYTRCLIRKNE